MTLEACLLCGGETSLVEAGLIDNRFGAPGAWNIHRCRACGLEQTLPRPDATTLKRLYETYYNDGGATATSYAGWRERFLMSPLYRVFLKLDGDISFHGERGTGRLLDVGCNEGRGLVLYRANGFAAEGLELNRVAAAEARARRFAVHEVDIGDFRPAAPFDRVVLSNVLEHALDPGAMLSDVHRLLAPGGEAWISLPNAASWLRAAFGRHWINWHVPYHIVHFTQGRLAALLVERGFEVASARHVTPGLWVAQSAIAFAFAGRPEQARRLRSTVLVAALTAVARGLLFPLLWWGNRRRRGDCLVVKARRL
ncbi:MAG TPA: class I SAM-dependent methyltransferase [Alphaproteobacteria bacterium]|nr:class I SAM-dependent methyltransferase [Alphaproteobacteria bacterium]